MLTLVNVCAVTPNDSKRLALISIPSSSSSSSSLPTIKILSMSISTSVSSSVEKLAITSTVPSREKAKTVLSDSSV